MLDIYHNGEMYTPKKEADKKYRKLEAERDALQAKLDRIKQVSDFPAKTKEMADYNSLIWKILEGKGDE